MNDTSDIQRESGYKGGTQRSGWSGSLSQELKSTYMNQVGQLPLLTVMEEQAWTKQYYLAKKHLQDQLNAFPALILSVANSIAFDHSQVRLEHFFALPDDVQKDDLRLRSCFNETLAKLNSLSVERLQAGDSRTVSAFWQAFQPMQMRERFYDMAVSALQDEQKRTLFVDDAQWERLSEGIVADQAKMREASNILVERNLRLVISIAGRYACTSIPLADLVQEGNIGLMKSIERFDITRNHRFSTYASYWIRQAITKYITNHSRIIRMPANTIAQISAIRQAEQEFLNKNGRVPNEEEIAATVGISSAKVRALQKMTQQPLSLQSIIDGDTRLEDTIPGTTAQPPPFQTDQTLLSVLDAVMESLEERERTILKLRFGLEDGRCHTLLELSGRFKVSSERIRQIENEALSKLRVPDIIELLEDFNY